MTEQTSLAFDVQPIVAAQGGTLDERFRDFHHKNPWIYQQLEAMTAELVASGQRRVGMKMLTEVLRWRYYRQTSGSRFKLDNSLTSRYARLMIATHPEWDGVFSTRELRTP